MSNTTIIHIETHRIKPHPKNVRRELGDLSELADSISVHGILQNLTVVPVDPELHRKKVSGKKAYPGDYWAVIGNRRHAAAIRAGRVIVPCVVADMDEKTQVATMMIENLQRSDLTYLEQAQGFQTMIDMGESVNDIAEQTGFSRETVRKRVKLLEHDAGQLQQAQERGATLQDLAELDKIKGPELRREVLDAAGTANFAHKLKSAIARQESAEKREAMLAELRTFATKIEKSDTANKKVVKYLEPTDFKKPDDAGEREYFFIEDGYWVKLYTWPAAQDEAEDTEQAQAKQREKERINQLDSLARQTYELRRDFIKGLTGLKKNHETLPIIVEFAVETMFHTGHRSFKGEQFMKLLDLEVAEDGSIDVELLSDPVSSSPERVLLLAAYSNSHDGSRQSYHDWRGEYEEWEALDRVYRYIERLGYEPSDEERAYRDGTHELFAGGENEQ
ncbi:MAG: ParB/RepB/Spo0J family partition protein [Oscillospiraceae bacterium]|nr:ParB/RepB/Spo0J family partition protein [Oscillospiraceae bacterium]